jgi:hypothetical protein
MANKRNFSTEIGKITKIDPSRLRLGSVTYVWQVHSEETEQYYDCTEEYLYSKIGPFSDRRRPEFLEVTIFQNAERFIDQLPYFEDYFKIPFGKRYHSFYSRLVISEPEFDKIHSFIQKAGLLKIEGFLFEIIILAQEVTTRMSYISNDPKTRNQILSAKLEINKLIKVIDNSLFDYKSFMNSFEYNLQLESIKFIFKSLEPIHIQNKWLRENIIQIVKDYYNGQKFKDWRKELLELSNQFENNSTNLKFGKLLAKSFYNFLSQEGGLVYESPYPNPLMSIIAELLSFSYIYPGTKDDKNAAIINKTRTWINGRNEVSAFNLSVHELPDLEFLYKHFVSQFIALGDPKDYEDTISSANFICNRFDVPEDIMPEIMHISACIRTANRIIGYQFTNTSSQNIEVPEFQTLLELVKSIREGKKITSLRFTIENENEINEFGHRLPLYLLEQAIHDYYESNTVEFESDVINTQFKMEPENGFPILKQERFNLPHERFFVRLTHSLLKFLNEFAGSEENTSNERSFQIIAILYKRNGVFRNGSEDFMIKKVREWYFLDAES